MTTGNMFFLPGGLSKWKYLMQTNRFEVLANLVHRVPMGVRQFGFDANGT